MLAFVPFDTPKSRKQTGAVGSSDGPACFSERRSALFPGRKFFDLLFGFGLEIGGLLLGLRNQLVARLLCGDLRQRTFRCGGFDQLVALGLGRFYELLARALRFGTQVLGLFGDLLRERFAAREFLYLLVHDVFQSLLCRLFHA